MTPKTVYCFYHRSDLDGHCSAAIVRRWAEAQGYNFVGIGVDYSDGDAPFEGLSAEGEDIIVIVDFCAKAEIMHDLNGSVSRLIWIDHHAGAIEMMGDGGAENFTGSRAIGIAACELCLKFFFPHEVNDTVTLLGRYDVWDRACAEHNWEHRIMPFQLALRSGMKSRLEDDTIPWSSLLNPDPVWEANFFDDTINDGKAIYAYIRGQEEYRRQFAYRSFWHGHDCVCINSGDKGSSLLEPLCNQDDLMVVWAFKDGKWSVGLYSRQDSNIDCGALAASVGGGGHKNAAGFLVNMVTHPLAEFPVLSRCET